MALSCACRTDLRRRRGRFFRPALLPGTRFGTGHVLGPIIADCTFAWRRRGPACTPRDFLAHRAAWRVPRWPRTPLAPAAGASDRGRRRLDIELCANRLRRHRPGVRVSRGLAHRRSNCAILLLHGPACAASTPRPRAATTSKVAEIRLMARRRICGHPHDVFDRTLLRFPARRRPDVRQRSVTSA